MRQMIVFVCGLLFLSTLISPAIADEALDPYEILEKYHTASGGLDKLKSVTSQYFEGSFTLATLTGTFKNWTVLPDKNRVELDLTVFKQTTGDNGEQPWEMDGNGKVMIIKDAAALIRRGITLRRNRYEHVDRSSKYFSLSYLGTDIINDITCHLVRTVNSLNSDTLLEYFSSENYLVKKNVMITPDGQTHSIFSDYRAVDGIMYPFHIEITELPTEQAYTIQFESGEINMTYDASLFDPPVIDAEDFHFASGDRAEDIPFYYIEEHIILPVLINGREKLWILDTGADMSVIDSAYAVELGLKQEGNMTGSGVSNSVEFSFVKTPPYSVGGVQLDSQMVASSGFVSPFCYKLFGEDMVGILGYDFLSRFVTKIDYAKRLISFYDPKSFKYSGSGSVIDAPLKGNSFAMPMTIDGKYSGSWNFDCGAGGSAFHYPYAEANDLLSKKGIERMGFGAGGSSQSMTVPFDKAEIGGFEIDGILVRIPMQKGKGAFAGGELIGNLGNDILRHFVVWIDYDRQQVILERGDDFGKKFPRDRSGLQVALTPEGEYEIIFVVPGSPAEISGFMVGDIILSMNNPNLSIGWDLVYESLTKLRDMFEVEGNVSYRIKVRRGDQLINLMLKLEDLL